MRTYIISLSAISALAFSLAFGQDRTPHDSSARMPRQRFGIERARLGFLVGQFSTRARILPGPMIPKEATGKGTSTIRWGLDSMFLVIDEESENALLGNYKGHGLLGYDSETKQYSLSMYNNFGDHPTYTGSFSGDTLLLKTTVPTPDGTFDQELLWYRDGENIHLQVLNDLGKGFKLAVDQVAAPFIARIKRGK